MALSLSATASCVRVRLARYTTVRRAWSVVLDSDRMAVVCTEAVWLMQVSLVVSVSELMMQAWLAVELLEVATLLATPPQLRLEHHVPLCLVQFRLRRSSRTVQCQ